MPERSKRIRLVCIESQRRHSKEQFRRALDHFVQMTSKNRRFGQITK